MLGHRRITEPQEVREIADRALAVDQLTDDQESMPVGERLQEIARLIRRSFHLGNIYFHTCVYTMI